MFTSLHRSRKPPPQAARVASRRRPGFRPWLEVLEDRLAPATLIRLAPFARPQGKEGSSSKP